MNDDNEHRGLARVICLAAVIVGLYGLYQHWSFGATWSTGSDGNVLGTGWLLEAIFWALRGIPGYVLCGLLVVLGGLALFGNSLPAKDQPQADDERSVSPMPPGSSGLRRG